MSSSLSTALRNVIKELYIRETDVLPPLEDVEEAIALLNSLRSEYSSSHHQVEALRERITAYYRRATGSNASLHSIWAYAIYHRDPQLRFLLTQFFELQKAETLPIDQQLSLTEWFRKHWKMSTRTLNLISRKLTTFHFEIPILFSSSDDELQEQLMGVSEFGPATIEEIIQSRRGFYAKQSIT